MEWQRQTLIYILYMMLYAECKGREETILNDAAEKGREGEAGICSEERRHDGLCCTDLSSVTPR